MSGTVREMDEAHRVRVDALLRETGIAPDRSTQEADLAAYNAVLLKDTLWMLSELLTYKQRELGVI